MPQRALSEEASGVTSPRERDLAIVVSRPEKPSESVTTYSL